MKLLSNSFEYSIESTHVVLYYSEREHSVAKRKNVKYLQEIDDCAIEAKLEISNDCENIYYSFCALEGLEKKIELNISENGFLKREFVKWQLYATLCDHYLVDLTRFDSSVTIYIPNTDGQLQGWDSFSVYNLLITNWDIHLSIASRDTLISHDAIPPEDSLIKLVLGNNVVHKGDIPQGNYRFIASQEKRLAAGIAAKPKFPNYNNYYHSIKTIYSEIIEHHYFGIKLSKDGFIRLQEKRDYFSVARSYNVMLFKNGKTNVNAANGLKLEGPFLPPKIEKGELEFIYIYDNSDRMKALYFDLRNGKSSYFPGLERYVDIPIHQPTKEYLLKYETAQIHILHNQVDGFVKTLRATHPEKKFFAIVLLPQSKKDSVDNQLEYFELKHTLLNNGIPSQFIDERAVQTDNFIYWLPNIAIAIQAKLGGIPWKLNRPEEKELIVGFGDASGRNNNFVGSAVFFDNSGKLKASGYFKETDLEAFKQSIKAAILSYIRTTATNPERLIIHYYKLPGTKEKDAVLAALMGLGIDIPVVIVTINDSKAKDYIAFDEDYSYGMPMSGIAWRVSKNEFVLFNNTRYEELPRAGKPQKQEYPIKLKIWFSNRNSETEDQFKNIIGQVFEFSRIYWKSVAQQSKPVTAVYSELIAEFGKHFGDTLIPNNDVTQNTPWFI